MKISKLIIALVLCAFLAPSVALAGDASPWTEEDSTTAQMKGKLAYGLKNLLGGWTPIMVVPSENRKEGKPVIGGIFQGIYDASVYMLGGALHTATFFIPQIDIPIKDGGVQFN